jgi:hypothetical protein
VLGPFAGPRTPFNVSLPPERTFATFALPLAAMISAKNLVGASLNDAFLALCGGGVRRYLSHTQDLPPRSLVASVPVATEPTGGRLSGNHVDNLFVSLHTEGIGLNITAWSYVDTLYVSLLGCPSSLPDPWRLADDIDTEMAALAASM